MGKPQDQVAEDQTSELTDEELDAIEAEKADRAEEIATAVAEAVANVKAEMQENIDDLVAKAVAQALKNVKAPSGVDAAPVGTGIYDPNPVKAKIAREKSKTKKVITLNRGYYGVILREEGDVFDVPVDEKADWFEDYKGGANRDEELV